MFFYNDLGTVEYPCDDTCTLFIYFLLNSLDPYTLIKVLCDSLQAEKHRNLFFSGLYLSTSSTPNTSREAKYGKQNEKSDLILDFDKGLLLIRSVSIIYAHH